MELIKLETDEIKPIKCKICGNGMLVKEDRHEQFQRIERGIKALFPYEKDERVSIFARNYIGFGPIYMFKCNGCGILKKIIPDGRDRE